MVSRQKIWKAAAHVSWPVLVDFGPCKVLVDFGPCKYYILMILHLLSKKKQKRKRKKKKKKELTYCAIRMEYLNIKRNYHLYFTIHYKSIKEK